MSRNSDAKRLAEERGISYTEALRIVRQVERLARQLGIKFPEALRLIDAGQSPAPSLEQLLRNELDKICGDMTGKEVQYEYEEGRWTGELPFGDVTLPHHKVEGISIDVAEPDLDTMMIDVAEEYEGGTQAATIEVAANVSFDGYMHKSDVYSDDGISVLTFDWNDHMSHVSFHRRVALIFHAVLEPALPTVEDIQFVGATENEFWL